MKDQSYQKEFFHQRIFHFPPRASTAEKKLLFLAFLSLCEMEISVAEAPGQLIEKKCFRSIFYDEFRFQSTRVNVLQAFKFFSSEMFN
jgi:hypothetical protein